MADTLAVDEWLGRTLGHVRARRHISARRLEALAEERGVPGLDRQRIANLETGRGRPMSVQEWLDLSYLLDVDPINFVTGWPLFEDVADSGDRLSAWSGEVVQLHPDRVTNLVWLMEWIQGMAPPPGTEVPDAPVNEPRPKVPDLMMQWVTELAHEHGLEVTFKKAGKSRG